jgi:hypothetical protein
MITNIMNVDHLLVQYNVSNIMRHSTHIALRTNRVLPRGQTSLEVVLVEYLVSLVERTDI